MSNNAKLLRYISISLNLGLREEWAPSHRNARTDPGTGLFVRDNGTIVYDEIERFSARHTGSLSLTAQTNIYGLFPVRIGNLTAIRHTIKPSLSYRYSPDFSRPLFGYDLDYFQIDSQGDLFDRFAGSTIGGTSRSEQQAVTFSVTNLFQGKREIDGEETKINLLNWSMSGGYNFAAESFRLAPLNSRFRSPLLDRLNLDISEIVAPAHAPV